MTVTVSKPQLNLREELSALKKKTGVKGEELLRSNTIADAYASLNPVMFRNKVINGNFDVWQRGTSFNSVGYTADRWRILNTISGSTVTQQAFSAGDIPFPGAGTYFLRFTPGVDSVNAGDRYLSTLIEDYRQFDNKTVTISFWYRNTASLMGHGIQLRFKRSSSIYDSFGDLGLPALDYTSQWKYYSVTVKCPSFAGQTMSSTACVEFGLYHQRVSASGNIDLAAVQIEEGNVATPFERRPYPIELALCQRYFQNTFNYRLIGGSNGGGGGTCYAHGPLIVPMRTTPSCSVSGNVSVDWMGAGVYTSTNPGSPNGVSPVAIKFDIVNLGASVTGYIGVMTSGNISAAAELS